MDICFINLGCAKNLVDAEKIISKLIANGYKIVDECSTASLVIVNTCGFINDAIQESFETIADALKENGKVIVTGCLGTKKELLLKKFPQLIAITPPSSADEVLKIVKKYLSNSKSIPHKITPIKLTPKHYAYLKVAEGCDHRCSYCIIPQLRGKLISAPLTTVLKEAEHLVNTGTKELIVIAQDTGAYGKDLKPQKNLITLANELGKFGVWIRLHYLYPYPFIDEIIPLMAEKKILPYLDIPLQHINQRILKLMQRPARNTKNILQRIESWRHACPSLTIRSTFIVGFPSETNAEFNELLDFLEEARLDRVGCFKYSNVKGAKANDLPKQIPAKIKNQRFHQLMSLQQQISANNLQTKVGQTLEVLIDETLDKIAIGRTMGDSPEIDGKVIINDPNHKAKIGKLVKVKITNADNYDLFGGIYTNLTK